MDNEIKDTDVEKARDTHGEACSNCKYWFELQENEPMDGMPHFGKCKKNPPAMLVQDDKTYSGHPITRENDWCGSWFSYASVSAV